MPRRDDIKRILIIGAGPIVIGQACEFDYSGSQACKALMNDGYEVILVNSNPATIMTDPEMATRTYIEPVTPEVVEKIILREMPDAILPTLGGQTGLNTAVQLAEAGALDAYGVEMIGARLDSIQKAEGRELFRTAMDNIGLEVPESGIARSVEEAEKIAEEIGLPIIIRPAFTLGGTGGGVAYNIEELRHIAATGCEASLTGEILVEESVIGWKEYELEVMRDLADNVVIVCSIENLDPMGIHTGDSITVAPAQTLTDREYQRMRDASLAVMREIGVETGGSNIQFAVDPATGRMVVIEMNPRVSRSSALASKATGFPIAKMAAKLAVGYLLEEISNDITRETPACFEPSIDYCVVKIPRFAFEKFSGAEAKLTTAMKSVGETMAIGRTFKEALGKGLRGLETGVDGFVEASVGPCSDEELAQELRSPGPERILYVREAFARGWSREKLFELTWIDPWFLDQLEQIHELEVELREAFSGDGLTPELLRRSKEMGVSDRALGRMSGGTEPEIRALRKSHGIEPVFKLVDTCAAEFEAYTPYYYSTYEREDESRPSDGRKVVILGGGPNRIGQGIEFDYCCCQAAFALREMGYESIMVNSNPETVSTDYDTSDKLFFEPVTPEDVINIVECEKPIGVIVQLGGQTPLNLCGPLEREGVRILGTSPASIAMAEDRKQFTELLSRLDIEQPDNGTAMGIEEAVEIADRIGYPVLVRPSFVLGGRAMDIVYDEQDLRDFFPQALAASLSDEQHPILIDKFLEDAVEVDVDAIADGETCIVGGVMEHIEEAGVHSGDSACVLPPHTLSESVIRQLEEHTSAMAMALDVRGLINVQYAIRNEVVYVLEVNPRASRTVPFVSKATGRSLVKIATRVMMGEKLADIDIPTTEGMNHVAVKESAFPFGRFPGVDAVLGPEMRSTGEVMGIARSFGTAFAKAQEGVGAKLPSQGTVFLSMRDRDKRAAVLVAKRLEDMGFELVATSGTATMLTRNDVKVTAIKKISEGRPSVIDLMKNGAVDLILNTPSGKTPRLDEVSMRTAAIRYGVPLITTLSGAQAAVGGIESAIKKDAGVLSLQEYIAR